MNLNCQHILRMTEAQLRYKSDVSLQEATPQELHEALSQAVMMSISEDWAKSKRSRQQGRKATISLQSISLAAWYTATCIIWAFWMS